MGWANQAVTLCPSLLAEIRATTAATCGRDLTAAERLHTMTDSNP